MARIQDASVEAVKQVADIVPLVDRVTDHVAGMTDRFALAYPVA